MYTLITTTKGKDIVFGTYECKDELADAIARVSVFLDSIDGFRIERNK